MVRPQQQINSPAEPVTLRSVSSDELVLEQWRKNLADQLQGTLEPEAQLRRFFDAINQLLHLDGLAYANEAEALEIQLGRQGSHTCGYRLIRDRTMIGELVFRRERQFIERELALLESTLAILVNPLRCALQYRRTVTAALQDEEKGSASERPSMPPLAAS